MLALLRLACLLCAAPGLSACAPILALVGTNQTFVQVIAQLERVKLAGDGASYAASDKTISDHALSKATGKECKIFNILTKESVCVEKTPVVAADSDAQPMPGPAGESSDEPGVQANTNTAPKAPAIEIRHEQAAG